MSHCCDRRVESTDLRRCVCHHRATALRRPKRDWSTITRNHVCHKEIKRLHCRLPFLKEVLLDNHLLAMKLFCSISCNTELSRFRFEWHKRCTWCFKSTTVTIRYFTQENHHADKHYYNTQTNCEEQVTDGSRGNASSHTIFRQHIQFRKRHYILHLHVQNDKLSEPPLN